MYLPTGRELIDPFNLLKEADIRSGMKVADFGCGTLGHYVFPASQLVGPDGRVYAVDILKSVLSGIEGRIRFDSATNVEPVWGDMERPGGVALADNSLDIGLLINNLFMSKQRDTMIKECVRMIKPGGRLVVVDWRPTGVNFGPDVGTRLSVDEARQLGEKAGLKLEKLFEPGRYHYGLIFTKPKE
ncbi:MAG: methyltransferase domain-containing protein [Patescibacteria group bacterium]|nr:methyltransferase domain-containing protein [Patescibacteria group bacterium]